MPDPLNITRDSGVVRIELNRPDAGNAIDEAVLDALASVLAEIRYQSHVRVLTLSGAGEDFCLGGDRAELNRHAAADNGGAVAIRRIADKAKHICETLSTLHAVTIARVHGRSIGAGVLLAVSCDLRVGTQESSFRLPELALGMPTAWGGGLARLISEVGIAKTREMVLLGDIVTAETALSLSILHRAAESTQEADQIIEGWIRRLLRRSETAERATKDLFNAYARSAVQGDVSALDSMILSEVAVSRARRTPIRSAVPESLAAGAAGSGAAGDGAVGSDAARDGAVGSDAAGSARPFVTSLP